MRTLISILIGLALLTSGCASTGYSSSANTCEEVADEMISAIADFVDDNAGVSRNDIEAEGEDFLPEGIGSFDDRGGAIKQKADDLSCSIAQLEDLVAQQLGSINADTYYGRVIVDEIRANGVFGGE